MPFSTKVGQVDSDNVGCAMYAWGLALIRSRNASISAAVAAAAEKKVEAVKAEIAKPTEPAKVEPAPAAATPAKAEAPKAVKKAHKAAKTAKQTAKKAEAAPAAAAAATPAAAPAAGAK